MGAFKSIGATNAILMIILLSSLLMFSGLLPGRNMPTDNSFLHLLESASIAVKTVDIISAAPIEDAATLVPELNDQNGVNTANIEIPLTSTSTGLSYTIPVYIDDKASVFAFHGIEDLENGALIFCQESGVADEAVCANQIIAAGKKLLESSTPMPPVASSPVGSETYLPIQIGDETLKLFYKPGDDAFKLAIDFCRNHGLLADPNTAENYVRIISEELSKRIEPAPEATIDLKVYAGSTEYTLSLDKTKLSVDTMGYISQVASDFCLDTLKNDDLKCVSQVLEIILDELLPKEKLVKKFELPVQGTDDILEVEVPFDPKLDLKTQVLDFCQTHWDGQLQLVYETVETCAVGLSEIMEAA